jgi:hypothetical protein
MTEVLGIRAADEALRLYRLMQNAAPMAVFAQFRAQAFVRGIGA